MRHGNKTKKLGRTHAHRKATLAALSTALITHRRITTTLAKAKALRVFVEPILHRAKDDSTASRRQAFRRLQDKEALKALFGEVGAALGDRPGGYTRVVKLGQRNGDAAEMAVIELVDFNTTGDAAAGKKRTRRTRRSTARPAAAGTAATPAAPKKATGPDDFTRIRGIGPVFAEALHAAGIKTFNQLAKADLYALRDAIQEHTKVSDEAANEETWAAQAALAAAGDWDGLEAYAEGLKAGVVPDEPTPAAPAEDAPQAEAGPPADEPVDANTATPNVAEGPSTHLEGGHHPDAEQGAPPMTGPPPPESDPTNRGRSGHRG